ncbi:MAG: transcriptional repressor [bacterium]|nr:transcriptional repressor [bacterium]
MMKQTVRMTHQREIILDELKRTRTHPTADELYTRVKKRLPRISLATVYRNLETLSSAGLVAKLEITGRQKRFDWNQQPHDHITCTECHRIDDILPPPGTGRHCDMPVNQHGYNLTGWRVEYFGICPSCQYKQNKEKNMSTTKLSDSQQAILKAMDGMDGACGSKDLVAATGLEAKQVSCQLTALKKKGLIESPARCKYCITAEGKNVLA